MSPQPPSGQGPADFQGCSKEIPPSSPGNSAPPYVQGPGPVPPMMPPPGYYPPMMPPMGWRPPPPPPRGSVLRTLFLVVLVLGLIVSVMLNIFLVGGSLLGSSGPLENTVRAGNANQRIVVIPVEGVITEETAAQMREWMRSVDVDPKVRAVLLEVNTPGGVLTPSDEIHKLLADFKTNHPSTPVVVSMGSMATSGGYYISCGADYIFAQPTTLTANIGVRMDRYNISGLVQKWGIQENTITAPAKGFKNAGSMFLPENPSDTAYLQELIDSGFRQFKGVVQSGRQGKLMLPPDQIFNGAAFTADKALKAGLVDQIGYEEDALAWAAMKAGLSAPTVVRYRRRVSFFDALGAESSAGPAQRTRGGAGVSVHVDRDALTELSTPRVMCIYRGD